VAHDSGRIVVVVLTRRGLTGSQRAPRVSGEGELLPLHQGLGTAGRPPWSLRCKRRARRALRS
jgi:hypothetical protein